MSTLDRLSTQWGMTRSDTIRKLIRDFDRAVREVREEACRTCGRLSAAYLFESMLLNPMVVYHLINANRDLIGDRDFIIGWVVTTDHRVFFSHADDLGRYLLRAAREYVRKYYSERETSGEGGTQPIKRPQTQPRQTAPKAPAAKSCYRVVVAYPDGTRRDVAEVLTKGCKNEVVVEVSPEDYEGYLRNELTLDDLVKRGRETRPATNAAGGGPNTQNQSNNPQQLQQNKQIDLRGLPYLTLGEIALRLGLLRLPNNTINRKNTTVGGA